MWTTYKKLEEDYGAQKSLLSATMEKLEKLEIVRIKAPETEEHSRRYFYIEKIYYVEGLKKKRKEEGIREEATKFHTNPNCTGLNATKDDEELVCRLLCQTCSKRVQKGKAS